MREYNNRIVVHLNLLDGSFDEIREKAQYILRKIGAYNIGRPPKLKKMIDR